MKYKTIITTILVIPLLVGCSSDTLKPKDNLKVELGNTLSNNVEDYLDLEGLDEQEKAKVLAETKLTIENAPEDGQYILGEYTVKLVYGEEEKEVKVVVADTTKPTFKTFTDKVDTYQDVKPDYTKLFVAEDLSKTTIAIDDSSVDYTKVGTYDIKVTAKDTSDNTETRSSKIVIQEPTIKLNKTKVTLYAKETTLLKPTVKGKDSKVTWTSSKTSVATVNEKGLVTTKKAGKTTITAEANGVKTTATITVKVLPYGYELEKKKDSSGNEIVSVKKKTGNAKGMIKAAKKYVGKHLWCSELIDKAFEDSDCDPGRYVLIGKNFMNVRAGDILRYPDHILLALASPQDETHSNIPFKEEAQMQELYLIEGGVTYEGSNTPHVEIRYAYFTKEGYRFGIGSDYECRLQGIYRFK